MKRILIVAAAAFLLIQALPNTASAFGVSDVVAMHKDGIPDSLIIAKIDHSDARFRLSARDFHTLKEAGVSNDVVGAMLETEDSQRQGDPYGSYYHSSYYLGLGFYPYGGWYGGYYRAYPFGTYYRPYYRPYVPYYGHGGYYGGHGGYYGGRGGSVGRGAPSRRYK